MPVSPRPCLSVVIPCFNEEETVQALVGEVCRSPWVVEIIAVDDGSSDKTLERLREIEDVRLRLIEHEVNQGKGAALRTGFAAATAEYVIVQDADLEYDPAEFGLLLESLELGLADAVYGSRFISGRPHRVLFYWHSVGNRLLTTFSNMMTNLNLTDMETCYKAFRREVIQAIDIEENRFGVEPELTAKLAARGAVVYEVGISYNGRTYADGKKIGWKDGFRAVYVIAKYSPLVRRIRNR